VNVEDEHAPRRAGASCEEADDDTGREVVRRLHAEEEVDVLDGFEGEGVPSFDPEPLRVIVARAEAALVEVRYRPSEPRTSTDQTRTSAPGEPASPGGNLVDVRRGAVAERFLYCGGEERVRTRALVQRFETLHRLRSRVAIDIRRVEDLRVVATNEGVEPTERTRLTERIEETARERVDPVDLNRGLRQKRATLVDRRAM